MTYEENALPEYQTDFSRNIHACTLYLSRKKKTFGHHMLLQVTYDHDFM